MRILYSEYQNNYKTYTFSYAKYAVLEDLEDLNGIYSSGFLPYTGSPDLENYFYFCRSLRIDLNKFKLNSENKRVLKKHGNHERRIYTNFTSIPIDLQDKVIQMYLNYFRNMHGENIMPEERLKFVLNSRYQNKNVLYFKDGELVSGMIMVEDLEKESLHVWYIGYKDEYKSTGFGIWMFLDIAEFAKENKYKYFYLGTSYGAKAKYKLNFEGIEFFEGNNWSNDIPFLKNLLKVDSEPRESDSLKAKSTFF